MSIRRDSRRVTVGNVEIGGGAPLSVQSMTNTDTADFAKTEAQIRALCDAGCDIVRLAVPDEEAAGVFSAMKSRGITVPLVADIHFDYKLALASVRSGASKIRINPGNIGADWKVKEVADACLSAGLPIRIGVNGGSWIKRFCRNTAPPPPRLWWKAH